MAEVKAAEAHMSQVRIEMLPDGPARRARQARLEEERQLHRKIRGIRLAIDVIRRLRGRPASIGGPTLRRATNVEEAIQKALDRDDE